MNFPNIFCGRSRKHNAAEGFGAFLSPASQSAFRHSLPGKSEGFGAFLTGKIPIYDDAPRPAIAYLCVGFRNASE